VPAIARRYLKTAIVFLIYGMLVGLHVGAAEYAGWGTLRQPYIVAHTHILMLGFLLMLIMGVAQWMFPRPAEGDGRHKPGLALLAWWMLTIGVVVRSTGEIVSSYVASHALGVTIFLAACLEVLAVIVFFVNLWPRIRSPREELARRG
jgi:heme/copper-type cytochrome/quinol oxidase subunit 1